MERMAGGHAIQEDDEIRRSATKSFQAHLTAIVRRSAARNVPVVVCTVPTNERGLAPIGPDVETLLPAGERQVLQAKLARAEELLSSEPQMSAELSREVVGLQSTHARVHLMLAAAASTRLGRHVEALPEYIRARTLARALSSTPPFRSIHRAELGKLLDWETYARQLGRSVYTDYEAANYVRALFRTEMMKRNNEAIYRRSETRCEELLAGMSELDRTAVERWRDPSLHGATDQPLEFVIGLYRMRAGDYETAARLFRVARASVAPVSLWRLELTWHLLACNRHLHAGS
jgi:hypothetical protein